MNDKVSYGDFVSYASHQSSKKSIDTYGRTQAWQSKDFLKFMIAYSEIVLLSGLCFFLLVSLLAGCLFRKKKKEEEEKKVPKRTKPVNPRPIKLAERPTPPGQTCPVIDIKW
ncbi:hypothetical protein T10_248 [Trichinella papuae]|uniref:Uncharacterized protein n=1 Tax=Trichinella papuae TaxID=268474 RepID=A0A0V1N067_9BILA|nr:hypothetical protein T10_248 [Trichinella papuae]